MMNENLEELFFSTWQKLRSMIYNELSATCTRRFGATFVETSRKPRTYFITMIIDFLANRDPSWKVSALRDQSPTKLSIKHLQKQFCCAVFVTTTVLAEQVCSVAARFCSRSFPLLGSCMVSHRKLIENLTRGYFLTTDIRCGTPWAL